MVAGKAPLIFPQDEGISCSCETGDFMALAAFLSLFYHAQPQQSCTAWNTGEKWRLENGQIKDWSGGVKEIQFVFCFFTILIAPVLHVGSEEKLNLVFSDNLIQAWASLHSITEKKPLFSLVAVEQTTCRWLTALSLNHRVFLPRPSSNPRLFGEHSIVKKVPKQAH